MFLDRCCTALGQQKLYACLEGNDSIGNVQEWETLILQLEDQELRDELIIILATLSDADAYYVQSLFQEKFLERPKWFNAIRTMSILAFLSIPLIVIYPGLWLLSFGVLAINLSLHYWNKRNLLLYSRSMPHLLGLIDASRRIKRFTGGHEDVKLDESISQLQSLSGKLVMFRLEKGIQSEIGMVVEFVIELFRGYFFTGTYYTFQNTGNSGRTKTAH